MADSLTRMLAAAKRAVRVASRLAVSVSARGLGASDSTSKTDASPVTIADYGSQAALNLLLLHTLAGEAAVSSLLSGAGAPASFRVLGEESASSLEEGDPALLAAVLAAFSSAMAPKAELAGVVAGGGSSSAAGGAWTSTDVLRALAAGSCQGGLACEGEGEGRGYWTMDPIDGTKGYLRGGQYAVGLAYIRDGTPVLAVMACPCLPLPTWEGSSPSPLGALFAATLGGGATQEPLFAEGTAAAAEAQPTPITTTPAGPAPKPAQHLTLCESFESGHSNRAVSEAVARALGLVKPPIRMDSMGKYALVARGCGDVYFRMPPGTYSECVWDHAPGYLLLREAGGVVTDTVGQPLDFSLGPKLLGNRGVIGATTPALHAATLAAIQAVVAAASRAPAGGEGGAAGH